jgi:hypothetical protein
VIATLAGAMLLAVATGTVTTRLIMRDPAPRSLLVALALGGGLGLGITACAFFAWIALVGPSASAWFVAAEVLVLAGLVLAWRLTRLVSSSATAAPSCAERPPLGWGWRLAFGASAAAAAGLFLARLATSPHGGWDAWMTWNRTARFIFRGESHWRDAFSPIFRHPDYPLLVPGAVARAWAYMGTDSPLAPAAVAAMFTCATVALAGAALARLRTDRQGLVATLLLLATPSMLMYGASQYADIPLAFFVLAAIALLFLHDRAQQDPGSMVLAGAAAGLAAWTKNEGLLFLAALVLARCVAVSMRQGWRLYGRELRWFTIGLAPVLVIVAYFKLHFAPVNDLVAGQGLSETLPRLVDAGRYLAVARVFKLEVSQLAHNGLVGAVPLLIGYLLCVGVKIEESDRAALVTAAGALALTLAGYVVVLVTAPDDFLRLLNRSVDRLVLHVWPAIVFTCFMVARAPEEGAE